MWRRWGWPNLWADRPLRKQQVLVQGTRYQPDHPFLLFWGFWDPSLSPCYRKTNWCSRVTYASVVMQLQYRSITRRPILRLLKFLSFGSSILTDSPTSIWTSGYLNSLLLFTGYATLTRWGACTRISHWKVHSVCKWVPSYHPSSWLFMVIKETPVQLAISATPC